METVWGEIEVDVKRSNLEIATRLLISNNDRTSFFEDVIAKGGRCIIDYSNIARYTDGPFQQVFQGGFIAKVIVGDVWFEINSYIYISKSP